VETVILSPLRDYQARAHVETLAAIQRSGRALCVAPCGAGKTRLAIEHVAERTAEGQSGLWIAPGKDLVRQPVERLLRDGWEDVAWISDGRRGGRADARLTVATIQGLEALAGAGKPLPRVDYLVIDEARSCATDGRIALLDRWPEAVRIGYDASPIGPRGVGLGRLFRELVIVAQPGELINAGFLAPYIVFAPRQHQAELARDPVTAWRLHVRPGGEPTLAYCRDVAHAEETAAAFARAGIAAACLSGRDSNERRASVLLDLAAGRLRVVTSAVLLRQGIDVPEVSCIMVLRAALSLSLWVQMTGRGGRPKERCLVIDGHGAVHLHGHPADPRLWSLEGEAVRAIEGLPPCRQCSACLAWWPGDGGACPACGAELLPAPRAPVRVKVSELIEVFAAQDRGRKEDALRRYTEDAYRAALKRGLTGRPFLNVCQSAAHKWISLYRCWMCGGTGAMGEYDDPCEWCDGGKKRGDPPRREVMRIVRDLARGPKQQSLKGVE
jgi:superfamily II DNA or RNA helicase